MKKSVLISPVLILIMILLGLFLILFIVVSICYFMKTTEKKICPTGQVCLSQGEYQNMITTSSSNLPKQPPLIDTTLRDIKVLNDPLYPPLNRTDRNTFQGVVYETETRNINIPQNDTGDTFHLVGYLTSRDQEHQDKGGNNWQLMAREKDRNASEFYLIPTNVNFSIKIPLTSEIVVGERLRDIYSIPQELRFRSPLLNSSAYDFVEIPKTKYTDIYY